MSISYHCNSCKSDYDRNKVRFCPKCGKNLKKEQSYRIVVSHKGRRKTKLFKGKIREAQQIEVKLKNELLQRNFEEGFKVEPPKKVGEVFQLYVMAKRHEKKTIEDDIRRWNRHISKYLDEMRICDVKPHHIEQIKSKLYKSKNINGKPIKPLTIKQYLVLLRIFFNWSIKHGYLDGKNPANAVDLPKIKKHPPRYLTKEEFNKLMDVLNSWENKSAVRVVLFAIYTGLRKNEILKLKWEDVDLEEKTIFLRETKGGNSVCLPVNNLAYEVLLQAQKDKPTPDCEYVFPNRKGQKRVSFNKTWERMKKKAGLDIKFHHLRHNFASQLASNGVDIPTIQRLLNHKNISTTMVYAYLLDETLRKGVNKADHIFRDLGM